MSVMGVRGMRRGFGPMLAWRGRARHRVNTREPSWGFRFLPAIVPPELFSSCPLQLPLSGFLPLIDVALRGMVLAVLVLTVGVLLRDRLGLRLARACVALCAGLCVQVVSSTPLFEAAVPGAWQAPWVAISVANAVLFWIFVQALFDDEFAFRPVHVIAWLAKKTAWAPKARSRTTRC